MKKIIAFVLVLLLSVADLSVFANIPKDNNEIHPEVQKETSILCRMY